MQKWHKPLVVAIILLAMIFLWLSAHDTYVTRINHQQQVLIQALNQGNHDLSWSFRDKDDLVTGFGSGWQQQAKGLKVATEKADISLAFFDRFIVPDLYQQLIFSWTPEPAMEKGTQLLLEFSQVDSGVFYYSPLIKLSPGINRINLNKLSWTINHGTTSHQVNWQDLPVLNTLVWRFSQSGQVANKALLSDITIPQTSVLQYPGKIKPISAVLTNQLRQHWQKQRLNLYSPPVMQAYMTISPWWLFVGGIILLIMAIQIYRPQLGVSHKVIHKNSVIQIIALVALVTMVIQTKTLFKILEHQGWLAIALFILPTVLLLNRWLRPRESAAVVWLITLMSALVLFSVNNFAWSFIRDLPLYLLWAMTQQVILGPLVSDYFHKKAGLTAGLTALLCGVLFSLLHMPNQMLMLATFIAGILWSYSWLRYRNIYANAVSHALLALLFYQVMPVYLLGTARIGWWF